MTSIHSVLSIICWNIGGNLLAKLSCPEIQLLIASHDVVFLQETHLLPNQDSLIIVPDGYEAISRPRPSTQSSKRAWGGLVVIFRIELNLMVKNEFSSSDIMAVEVLDCLLINAYIPPVRANWTVWTDECPFERLMSLLAILRAYNKPVIILGDLNTRTGPLSCGQSTERAHSADAHGSITVRGRRLNDNCCDNEWKMLNADSRYGVQGARYTSFQPRGNSVIDYALVNQQASCMNFLHAFSVLEPDEELSDHAAICITIEARHASQSDLATQQQARRPINTTPCLGNQTTAVSRLDLALTSALESLREATHEARLQKLYGISRMRKESHPVKVYVDGASLNNGKRNARAGAGIFWGENSVKNTAARVPDEQTNNRGEVYAILRALQLISPQKTLHVYSDSEYAMDSLLIRGPDNAARGWTVKNGDLFRDIVKYIAMRPASVTFIQVKGHTNFKPHDAADRLAKQGAWASPVASYTSASMTAIDTSEASQSAECPGTTSHPVVPKVTHIPLPKMASKGRETNYISCDDDSDDTEGEVESQDESHGSPARLPSHRKRTKVHSVQKQNKQTLMNAETEKEFWNCLRQFMYAKRRTGSLTAEMFMEVFKPRMTTPIIVPPSFDMNHLGMNEALAALIPQKTIDTTRDQIFSRPFTAEEIAEAKDHLHKRMAERTASGSDGVGYSDFLRIDNDILANLFNECLDANDAPTEWLTTTLMAILKKDKDKNDPNGYRAIALESCGLKIMTLLIHKRLTTWCNDMGIIPPSQNGFREGYRTYDGVFILRCAIERANAHGLTLYVGFADLSNAFPATNHACLWNKMRRLGAGGKIFDWLRMLYNEMSYAVKHGNDTSERFKATTSVKKRG